MRASPHRSALGRAGVLLASLATVARFARSPLYARIA